MEGKRILAGNTKRDNSTKVHDGLEQLEQIEIAQLSAKSWLLLFSSLLSVTKKILITLANSKIRSETEIVTRF